MMLLVVMKNKKDEADFNEKYYECDDLMVSEHPKQIIFSLNRENPNKNIAVVIETKNDYSEKVFLMNNEGKTIHRWYINNN